MKTTTTLTGIAMAAAAAALLTAGCSTMKSEGSTGATMAKVHCEGATSCKGQGWLELTEPECKAAHGRS